MREMYDSDNLDDIPDTAEVVAYYDDGEPGSATPEQLARFAGKPLVSITRKYGPRCRVIDFEKGAASMNDVAQQIREGLSDTVYVAKSNKDSLETYCTSAGVTVPYWWIASWGATGLEPGSVATQYASPTQGNVQGHYDISYLSDEWPVPVNGGNVSDQTPNMPPDSQPLTDAGGRTINAPIVGAAGLSDGTGYFCVGADGGVFTFGNAQYHGSIPDLQEQQKMGKLNEPVVGIIVFDNNGYGLVAADGGIFAFGAFPFKGAVS